jgi:ATP-dependent DNA helicase RecG
MPELKVADLVRDVGILQQARTEAFELIKRDATLSRPEHSPLRQRIRQVLGDKLKLIDVG